MAAGAGERVTADTPAGSMVAAAVTRGGRTSWHRGRLEATAQFERRAAARVRLVDYGVVLEDIQVTADGLWWPLVALGGLR